MSSGLPDVSHSEHNFKDGKMYARSTKLEDRGRDGSPRVASERIALSFTPAAHYAGAHGMECAAAPPTSLQRGWTLSIGQPSLTSNHTVPGRHCSHIPLPQLSQLGSMDGQRSLTSNGVRVDLSSASLGPSTSPESDSGRNPRPSVISLLAQRTNQHTTAVSGISTRAGAWAVGPQRGFLPLSFFHPRPTITSLPTEHVNDTQQL